MTTAPPPKSALPKGKETILVVEDDDMVRQFAEGQLASLGYRVVAACNGPEALDIVRQRDDIDLIFTDVVMPRGMSGPALAAAARAIRPGLKVLYTTGYSDFESMNPAGADAAAPVLAKPYRRQDLAHKVHDVLANRAESAPAT